MHHEATHLGLAPPPLDPDHLQPAPVDQHGTRLLVGSIAAVAEHLDGRHLVTFTMVALSRAMMA